MTEFLLVTVLLWLRCVPLFWLTPYLALGVFPLLLGAALGWALSGSLALISLAGCHADAACAAALSGGPILSWGGAATQLVAGVVVAVGLGAPLFAFRSLGAIAQGLAGSQASTLARAAALVAGVSAVSADALSGVSGWLLTLPLSAAGPLQPELFRSLSDELLRAFELGVSLAGPLLLGAIFATIFLGLWGLIASFASARLSPVGPVLLPWLGIALVSLCVANWLDSVPELVRAFAQSSARLLNGLP